jgi:16S rRNA (cytidine1402-2'-O)-methyltransferase
MSDDKPRGVLYLVPNLIAEGSPATALPPQTMDRVKKLRRFVVEGEKAAWRLLSAILDREALAAVSMGILDEHTLPEGLRELLAPALSGESMGLISEAGVPCIADPGAPLVALAHEQGIKVVPLVGPSSIFLALAASGLDGQRFCFLGYLPADRAGRRDALHAMDRGIRSDGMTRIFIETPYRNDHLLADCKAELGPDTRLCVALAIGSEAESISSATIREWRTRELHLGKLPCIFLAGVVPPLHVERKNHLDHPGPMGDSRGHTCRDKKR